MVRQDDLGQSEERLREKAEIMKIPAQKGEECDIEPPKKNTSPRMRSAR